MGQMVAFLPCELDFDLLLLLFCSIGPYKMTIVGSKASLRYSIFPAKFLSI
jgi:hypothetical protein